MSVYRGTYEYTKKIYDSGAPDVQGPEGITMPDGPCLTSTLPMGPGAHFG